MSKGLIFVGLVMLIAHASAFPWRPCGSSSANEIKHMTIGQCDSNYEAACVLISGSKVNLTADYIQPKPIKHPVIRMEFEDGYYEEYTPLETGLSIPGRTGQEQSFSAKLRVPDFGRVGDLLMRLSVREMGASIEDTQICAEVATYIREPGINDQITYLEANDSFQ